MGNLLELLSCDRSQLLGCYSKILASTHETQRFFTKVGVPTELVPAIGINDEMVPPPQKTFSKGKPLRILYVGSLDYLKGIHFAIRALACSGSPTQMTIVGSGAFKKELMSVVEALGVSDKVEFLGQKNRRDLTKIYAEHDVLIFPSLHDSGGMAVLEAMAASLPVIALNCGGPALAVQEGCGVRVPLGSSDQIIREIADAIRLYSNDRNLLKQHGITARASVLSTYAWPIKIKRLQEIYGSVLDHV
jgi:glycosyltransferase involved in cell wall biosynthesis